MNTHRKLVVTALLSWYLVFSVAMSIAPASRQFWIAANVLPVLFVIVSCAHTSGLSLVQSVRIPDYSLPHLACDRRALHVFACAVRRLAATDTPHRSESFRSHRAFQLRILANVSTGRMVPDLFVGARVAGLLPAGHHDFGLERLLGDSRIVGRANL